MMMVMKLANEIEINWGNIDTYGFHERFLGSVNACSIGCPTGKSSI